MKDIVTTFTAASSGSDLISGTYASVIREWIQHHINNKIPFVNNVITYDYNYPKEENIFSKLEFDKQIKNLFPEYNFSTFFHNGSYSYFVCDNILIVADHFVVYEYVQLTFYGSEENYRIFHKKFYKPRDKIPKLHWYFSKPDGTFTQSPFNLKLNYKADEVFYPFLPNPLEEYIDRYLKSTSSIMILMGEPGTGKTSFIRHMLLSRQETAFYTFDDNVMNKDNFYMEFIQNSAKFLIIEDADLLLASRDLNNGIMAKFLNASDGLIQIPDKKIVFTTNIQKISSIDDAIMRPGRCFDLINFRKLNTKESNVICEKYDLDRLEGDKYSLTDIFNRSKNTTHLKPKVGFGI